MIPSKFGASSVNVTVLSRTRLFFTMWAIVWKICFRVHLPVSSFSVKSDLAKNVPISFRTSVIYLSLKAHDFCSFAEQICIFQVRKSEIFFSGSSNFSVAKMVKIKKSSKNRISHWILHPYYLQEYGITFLPSYSVEIISSMWGDDPLPHKSGISQFHGFNWIAFDFYYTD